MTLRTILIICLVLGLSGTLSAGEVKIIELSDGGVIAGEVLSLANGVYTIRTNAMGTVTVPDSKIRAIRSKEPASSSPAGTSSVSAGEIKALTDKMMADQDVMSMIESLKDDPEFAAVLQDPEIMAAIESGNTAALLANPKFLKLLNNATVQGIQKKVTH